MKLKKATSIILVLAMVLITLCSCSNVSTVATYNEKNDIPTGVYNYYLVNAFNTYYDYVDNQYLPKSEWTIEGQNFYDFIQKFAQASLYKYMTTEYLCDKYNLVLDKVTYAENIEQAEQTWKMYGSLFESQYGISKKAFDLANYDQFKTEQLQLFLYGKGGEKEISEDKILSYFTENFCRVKYVSDTISDNASELDKIYNDYVSRINTKNEDIQEIIFEEAARQNGYTKESARESLGEGFGTYFIDKGNTSYPGNFVEEIFALEDNEAHVYKYEDSAIVLYQKFDLMGDGKEYSESKDSLVRVISNEDYSKFLDETFENEIKYELNDSVIEKFSVTKLFG